MHISPIFRVLFLTLSFSTMTMTLLSAGNRIANAQISSMSEDKNLNENLISQVNVLFVNPSIGNDTNANGSETTPLKTISQALRMAKNGTVIRLAEGIYSAETGEQFPLILKSGVSIQGNVNTLGKNIIIQGGGDYLSRYYGSKNIAIFATDNAKLAGVTVTNLNPRGYGMWIESKQPVVEQNTFTGSTQDGVAVTGKAAPKISNNYFHRNGANGITVSGKSQPQIQQNTFQDTGFGVNIAQKSTPQVISNQISHNRTGVVIQASSRPVLRNNSIFNNEEDGLVVIAQAMPDLGNSSNPGGNQFNSNGRYDINAEAAKQEISAYGNTLENDKIAGEVNVTASAAPVKAQSQPTPKPALLNPQLRRETTASSQPPAPNTINTQEQLNYIQVQPKTIEFSAPDAAPQPIAPKPTQPPADTPSSLPVLQAAPTGESALVAVPTNTIPVSNNSNTNLPNSPTLQNPPQTQAATTQTSRYRVIVEAVTPKQQELVKFIVPDAFRTRRQGSTVMQAGIFSDRTKANTLVRQFKNNGLKAGIEMMK